ncbi:uncharacterized protein ACNS7B_021213 [Menidia menidia]
MAAGTGRAAFAVLVFRSAALLGWMRPCAAQSEVIGPRAPLVAPLGGEVVLPCSLQPAADVYGLTVEWARPDLRPKYVSVWRDGEELQANENPAFSGRKSLFTEELRRGNISLKLSDLRPSDQGSYRCYVPHLDRGAVVELQVVDPGSSRTAAWLAVLPVVGVLAAVTALWVLWRRTRLKRKKQQDAEAGGEEPRGRPLLEGEDQQDEDRSKENSSQVQLHTVTPAAEHLDPQKPAGEHLYPHQTPTDVIQKPDAEETHEEETETAGQDGNREGQTHPEKKGGDKGGDVTTGAKKKKLPKTKKGKKADKETEDKSLKDEGKHDESKGKKTLFSLPKLQKKENKDKKGGNKVSGKLEQTENKEKQKEELKQPLLEGGGQQDEDRSKENSSQVQLHTVTPAAEHLDLQALRDVRHKPDAEETHEEDTETGGQDGNGAAGGGTETNQNQEEGAEDQSLKKEGKHGEKEEKKKQSLEQKIQQKQRDEKRWGEKVNKIEEQIEDKENKIAELDQKLEEVEIQLKNTEEDLKKTEGQTETPQEEKEKAVKTLSDRREELQKKKEEVQKKLKEHEKKIEAMKKELDVRTARKNKATAEKTELKRELEELREAEASSSQTEEQRTLSTHNASAGSSCSTSRPVKNLKAEMMEFRLSS